MTFDAYLEPDTYHFPLSECPDCGSDNIEPDTGSGFACDCESCLDCGKFYLCLGCYKADSAGY